MIQQERNRQTRKGEFKMDINLNNRFPLAYDIKSFSRISGSGRSKIYEEIAAGRLVVRKVGRKTIILHEDAIAWLKALPVRSPSGFPSREN